MIRYLRAAVLVGAMVPTAAAWGQKCSTVSDEYLVGLDPCRLELIVSKALTYIENRAASGSHLSSDGTVPLLDELAATSVLGVTGSTGLVEKFQADVEALATIRSGQRKIAENIIQHSLSRMPSTARRTSLDQMYRKESPAWEEIHHLFDAVLDAAWGPVRSKVSALDLPSAEIGPRTLLLKASPGELHSVRSAIAGSKPLSLLDRHGLLTIEPNVIYSAPEESVPDRSHPRATDPSSVSSSPTSTDDPFHSRQWALPVIGAIRTWGHGRVGAPTMPVAIIDSGFRVGHHDLAGNLWSDGAGNPGRAFCGTCGPDFDPHDLDDETGHGTAVAGIIGARTNNGYGVAGLNWYPDLMILKAFHRNNSGAVSDLVDAIVYAIDNRASIVTAAWGGQCRSTALLSALHAAEKAGILVVAAAGNDSRNLDLGHNTFYPASFKRECPHLLRNMIVVGATDCRPGRSDCDSANEKKAHFSNWGEGVVEIGAPGVKILTAGMDPVKGVAEVTGSSAATAIVAGAAALVGSSLARTPNAPRPSTEELRCRLLCGATAVSSLDGDFARERRLDIPGAFDAGSCRHAPYQRICESFRP